MDNGLAPVRMTSQDRDNLGRIRAIRIEAGLDDAEALARLFEDQGIVGDGALEARLRAILLATQQHWLPGHATPLDLPGLREIREAGDRGFRPQFRDPWANSRDQIGHFLTALGLFLYPETVQTRRLGIRVRDWVRSPQDMSDEEVALRFIIGHEKVPDPILGDPRALIQFPKQFTSATAEDVATYRRALEALGAGWRVNLGAAVEILSGIAVGQGRGNSIQDLALSLMACRLGQMIRSGAIRDGAEVAAWIRDNLAGADEPLQARAGQDTATGGTRDGIG